MIEKNVTESVEAAVLTRSSSQPTLRILQNSQENGLKPGKHDSGMEGNKEPGDCYQELIKSTSVKLGQQ
ncbi:hypothetical protein Tco_0111467 [Tanacetum coccineum]